MYRIQVDVRTEAKGIEVADMLVAWLVDHTPIGFVPEDVLLIPDVEGSSDEEKDEATIPPALPLTPSLPKVSSDQAAMYSAWDALATIIEDQVYDTESLVFNRFVTAFLALDERITS